MEDDGYYPEGATRTARLVVLKMKPHRVYIYDCVKIESITKRNEKNTRGLNINCTNYGVHCSVIHVVGKVSIVDLLHHSVCIVFLVSNSPLVPASQEAVQDESKQSNRYNDR